MSEIEVNKYVVKIKYYVTKATQKSVYAASRSQAVDIARVGFKEETKDSGVTYIEVVGVDQTTISI